MIVNRHRATRRIGRGECHQPPKPMTTTPCRTSSTALAQLSASGLQTCCRGAVALSLPSAVMCPAGRANTRRTVAFTATPAGAMRVPGTAAKEKAARSSALAGPDGSYTPECREVERHRCCGKGGRSATNIARTRAGEGVKTDEEADMTAGRLSVGVGAGNVGVDLERAKIENRGKGGERWGRAASCGHGATKTRVRTGRLIPAHTTASTPGGTRVEHHSHFRKVDFRRLQWASQFRKVRF